MLSKLEEARRLNVVESHLAFFPYTQYCSTKQKKILGCFVLFCVGWFLFFIFLLVLINYSLDQ